MAPATEGLRSRLLDADDPAWSTHLQDCRHDVYHTPAYGKIDALHEAGRAQALLVEQGRRALLLPLIIRPVGDVGYDATSPYGYAGPLLRGTSDPRFYTEALQAGAETLRAQGVISLFVRLHPLLGQEPPRDFGTVVRHGDTVAVDLTLSIDDLLRHMRRNHRDQIRQAREAGYRTRFVDLSEGIDLFESMYRRTMARLGASEFYCFDDGYFDAVSRALGDRVRLALVEADGEVAAAGVFTASRSGIVEAHLTASESASRRDCARASKLMFFSAIEHFKATGQRWLHLGGGRHAEDDSLLHYKAGFSPLRFPFHTVRAVLRPQEYAQLVNQHDPDADPADIAGFFPAYRRNCTDPMHTS